MRMILKCLHLGLSRFHCSVSADFISSARWQHRTSRNQAGLFQSIPLELSNIEQQSLAKIETGKTRMYQRYVAA